MDERKRVSSNNVAPFMILLSKILLYQSMMMVQHQSADCYRKIKILLGQGSTRKSIMELIP